MGTMQQIQFLTLFPYIVFPQTLTIVGITEFFQSSFKISFPHIGLSFHYGCPHFFFKSRRQLLYACLKITQSHTGKFACGAAICLGFCVLRRVCFCVRRRDMRVILRVTRLDDVIDFLFNLSLSFFFFSFCLVLDSNGRSSIFMFSRCQNRLVSLRHSSFFLASFRLLFFRGTSGFFL